MTKAELAKAALEIEPWLRGRLVGDILSRTDDLDERAQLGAAVLGLLLRRYLKEVPGDPHRWLEEVVRMVLTP